MTQYSEWLASLGNLRADLPACTRRLPVEHTLTYQGDVRTATLIGSIKAAPDSETELAVFSVSAPNYNAGAGVTIWNFSLAGGTGPNSTGALPADTDGDGVTTLIYDLILTLPGGYPQRIAGGLFPVSGFVTEVP